MSVWEENFGRKTEGKEAGSRRFDLLWRIVCEIVCCATAPPQNNSPAATVVLYDVIVWISTASTACLAPPTDSTLGSFEMSKICAEPVSGDLRFVSVAALTKSMMGNNLLTTQLNYHIASNKRDAAFSSKMFNLYIWCHVVVLKLCMYIPKHYCSAISEWDMWLLYNKTNRNIHKWIYIVLCNELPASLLLCYRFMFYSVG